MVLYLCLDMERDSECHRVGGWEFHTLVAERLKDRVIWFQFLVSKSHKIFLSPGVILMHL